jgi:hypothetical protein
MVHPEDVVAPPAEDARPSVFHPGNVGKSFLERRAIS